MNKITNNYKLISDSTGYLHDTPGEVYSNLRRWLEENFSKNYREFIGRIATQFRDEYERDFGGHELIGSTGGRAGNNFFVHDLAIVDLVLAPILSKFGGVAGGWRWVKNIILDKEVSAKAPTFAKRATVPLLLERLTNDKTVKEAKKYLSGLIGLRKGIPSSNEIIFDKLRKRVDNISPSVLLELVQKDLDVTEAKVPTNVFVVILLFELMKRGSTKAEEVLLSFLNNDEYLKYDGWRYHTLDHFHIISNRADIQKVILEKLLKNKKWVEKVEKDAFTRGDAQRAFTSWATIEAKARIVKEGNLDFLEEFREKGLKSNLVIKSLPEVAKDYPEGVLQLLEGGILTDQVLREIPDSYAREQLVRVALTLSEKQREHHNRGDLRKRFAKGALWILDYFMEDPDPKPFSGEKYEGDPEFDYDKKVRNGEDINTITSVRGNIPWVLQNLANYELVLPEVYEKTKVLLGDENHYVIQQALVPLSLIAANKRMLDPKQKKELSQLIFNLLERYSDCLPLASYILRVFGHYRELNEEEARIVLDKLGYIDECAGLFIYFAVYRKDWYGKRFDPTDFEVLFEKKIKGGDNDLRRKIAWHFWIIINDDIDQVTTLERYATALSKSRYDRQVFGNLYQLVKVVIKEKKYAKLATDWFDNSLEGFLAYTKKMASENENFSDWMQYKEIFEGIAKYQPDQFLDLLKKTLEIIKTGNVSFYDVKDCFRASKENPELRTNEMVGKLDRLWGGVRGVYPRADSSWKD